MTIKDFLTAIRLAEGVRHNEVDFRNFPALKEPAWVVVGASPDAFGVCDEGIVVRDPVVFKAMTELLRKRTLPTVFPNGTGLQFLAK